MILRPSHCPKESTIYDTLVSHPNLQLLNCGHLTILLFDTSSNMATFTLIGSIFDTKAIAPPSRLPRPVTTKATVDGCHAPVLKSPVTSFVYPQPVPLKFNGKMVLEKTIIPAKYMTLDYASKIKAQTKHLIQSCRAFQAAISRTVRDHLEKLWRDRETKATMSLCIERRRQRVWKASNIKCSYGKWFRVIFSSNHQETILACGK